MKIINYEKALYFIIDGLDVCFKLLNEKITISKIPPVDLEKQEVYSFSEIYDYKPEEKYLIKVTTDYLKAENKRALEIAKAFAGILSLVALEDEDYELTITNNTIYFDLIGPVKDEAITYYLAGTITIATEKAIYILPKTWTDIDEIRKCALFKLFKEYHENFFI